MAEKFKWSKEVLTMDQELKIMKSIDAGTSYTVPVRLKVQRVLCPNAFALHMNVFPPQPGRFRLLYETRLNEKPNEFKRHAFERDAFERRVKYVRTRSQTRSNEKPNPFKREAKRVQTRSQTRSNKKPNAFEWETDQPPSLKVWNALKRDSKRLLTASKPCSKLSTDNVN